MTGSTLKIFDMKGKLLYEQPVSASDQELDVSGFPRGLVVISITGTTVPVVKKLLLN